MKKGAAIGIGVLCGLFLMAYGVYYYVGSPYDLAHSSRSFVVRDGESLHRISSRLSQEGFLRYPCLFEALVRFRGCDRQIRAGQYVLHSSMTPLDIFDALSKGLISDCRITIPEGYTLEQIASLMEHDEIVGKASFLEASRDPALLRTLRISADSMEGYLFPDTYEFHKEMNPESVLRNMVRRFREVITSDTKQRIVEMGWSLHEVVTLASIIEKETSREDERRLVASVLTNRLKKGMPLQSDPTVIYCIQDFDGNLTREHLETPIPYNTYYFKGLPVGPICNPGLASIHAALYPAETSYLFFVSKKDGTHLFSDTIQQHNRAVTKYQKSKAPKGRASHKTRRAK